MLHVAKQNARLITTYIQYTWTQSVLVTINYLVIFVVQWRKSVKSCQNDQSPGSNRIRLFLNITKKKCSLSFWREIVKKKIILNPISFNRSANTAVFVLILRHQNLFLQSTFCRTILAWKNQGTLRKTCLSATLSTSNPTPIGQRSNPDLQVERKRINTAVFTKWRSYTYRYCSAVCR